MEAAMLAHFHGCADVCSQNVTGPSFTRPTFMSAPNRPVLRIILFPALWEK
jgi:hypothetical protein